MRGVCVCGILADYKPVFATIPKSNDSTRSSRTSSSDPHRFSSASQPYDRYYDTPVQSLLHRDGMTL